MKWIRKFDSYMPEWNLEGADMAFASVFRDEHGEYHATFIYGGSTYPATDTLEFVLADILKNVSAMLKQAAADFAKQVAEGVPVENQESNVAFLLKSEDKAGYGYGWLIVREGREVPGHWEETVKLDDGRVAHIHPFVRAGNHNGLHEVLGVTLDTHVAGVRWFDSPKPANEVWP